MLKDAFGYHHLRKVSQAVRSEASELAVFLVVMIQPQRVF